MVDMKCIVTKSWDEFTSHVQAQQIAGLFGEDFDIDFANIPDKAIFLIKSTQDFSLRDALLGKVSFDSGVKQEDIYALIEFCADEEKKAQELERRTGSSNYRNLLSCLDDKEFTGILLMQQAVRVKKADDLGPAVFTGSLTYRIPFMQITNVNFKDSQADVQAGKARGILFMSDSLNLITDGFEHFSIQVDELYAMIEQKNFYSAQIICRLVFYEMFGKKLMNEAAVYFLGNYIATADMNGSAVRGYQLRMIQGASLYFSQYALAAVTLSEAETIFDTVGSVPKLQLNFRGSMAFAQYNKECDYFSYDKLPYRNFRVILTLSSKNPSVQVQYRDILLSEEGSICREGSFLSQIPHKVPLFTCFQEAVTPEKTGCIQINAGIPQQAIQKGEWFGLMIPMELFHGISLHILFAFGEEALFYAGAGFMNGKSDMQAAISSLFRMGWKEVQIRRNDTKYLLGFRGFKVSCLGKNFPEGSANLILVPDGSRGELGWCAVYDKQKKSDGGGVGS